MTYNRTTSTEELTGRDLKLPKDKKSRRGTSAPKPAHRLHDTAPPTVTTTKVARGKPRQGG